MADDLFTYANSSLTYTESASESLHNQTINYDSVIIQDADDDEFDDVLACQIESQLKEDENSDRVATDGNKSDSSKMDVQQSSEQVIGKNSIYANGHIFSEAMTTSYIKANLRTMKESIKAIKQIVDDIYEEFSTMNHGSSSRDKAHPKIFDVNKKKATDELLRRLDDSHKKITANFQTIEDKNFKMLEESHRKYYLEPRQTHAGSGGNGMKHSLNNPPTNASVFYTPEEAMTYIDSSGGSISSSVNSTADFEQPASQRNQQTM